MLLYSCSPTCLWIDRGWRYLPPLTLGVAVGEDGSDSLLTRGEVGSDVEERGSRARHVPT